jgi:branched-subunit amino acid aminotransferase/4-amino-4-deoxychorismate lyase
LKYQPLKRDQLEMIDEAFITSSSRGIVPVIQIDHVTIGQGSPGPVTNQLIIAYEEYVIQRAEKIDFTQPVQPPDQGLPHGQSDC